MKKLITLILGLIIIGPAYSQTKVDNFSTAVTANPVDKKIEVIDVVYKNWKFDSLQVRSVKNNRIINRNKLKRYYEPYNEAVREANLIDYKADTLYILSTSYAQDGSFSETIKTGKGIYDLIRNKDGEYIVRPAEDGYKGFSTQWRAELAKKSDFLLYNAVFNWDIDMLIQIIKASGGGVAGGDIPLSAIRIILKDNRVMKKDIINFEPAGTWVLNKEDLLY